jgi:hypothetical protein
MIMPLRLATPRNRCSVAASILIQSIGANQ